MRAKSQLATLLVSCEKGDLGDMEAEELEDEVISDMLEMDELE